MNLVPTTEIKEMAKVMGPLFKKRPEDMFALMLIAQAEGKHPAIAAQEYDIIEGKPAINSRSAQARFQLAGGSIKWLYRSEQRVVCELSHPQGGILEVTWDMERAKKAGLSGKSNWVKYPIQMLSARCVAEGVRALYPACLSGMYTVEEVQDFDSKPKQAMDQEIIVSEGDFLEDIVNDFDFEPFTEAKQRVIQLVAENESVFNTEQTEYISKKLSLPNPTNEEELIKGVEAMNKLFNIIFEGVMKKKEEGATE